MSWSTVADSKLSDASLWCGNVGASPAPACLPKSLPGGGNNLQDATIDAWVSGALNTDTDEFIFPAGGGDADWAGNQVLSFHPTNGWTMKRNASLGVYPPTGSPGSYKYSDGTPAAKHTYDSIVYMPTKQRFWCGGGIFWPNGNNTPEVAWWLNPTVNPYTWTEKATRPGGYAIVSCWDPTTSCVLIRTSSGPAGLYRYNPNLEDAGPNPGAYTRLFSQSGGVLESSPLALDDDNRKLYRIDRRTTGNPSGGIKVVDLNNLAAREVPLTTVGDIQVETQASPGLLYRDGRLIATGPSSVAGRWAVYTAVVDGFGGVGQDPVQWVRDDVDANEPLSSGSRGTWKKFFGPIGGKYYLVTEYNRLVSEYTPSWSASTDHTVEIVCSLTFAEVA